MAPLPSADDSIRSVVLAIAAGVVAVIALIALGVTSGSTALAEAGRANRLEAAYTALLALPPPDEASTAQYAATAAMAREVLSRDARSPPPPPVPGPAVLPADTREVTALRAALSRESAAANAAGRSQGEHALRFAIAAALLLALFAIVGGAFVVAQIRNRRALLTMLERDANHDPLTMLPNRRFFLQWLGYALAQARRDGTVLGLVYLDLDGFKAVNDRQGHRRGDAVLAAIAERLRSTKRESDVLARLGGDEFALAAPNARDGRELAALGERLIASLRAPELPKLADVPLGASIGIAFFPDDADDVPGLIAAADAAMYAAKRAGRQRVAFYATAGAL